jgi:hypothetical protein
MVPNLGFYALWWVNKRTVLLLAVDSHSSNYGASRLNLVIIRENPSINSGINKIINLKKSCSQGDGAGILTIGNELGDTFSLDG